MERYIKKPKTKKEYQKYIKNQKHYSKFDSEKVATYMANCETCDVCNKILKVIQTCVLEHCHEGINCIEEEYECLKIIEHSHDYIDNSGRFRGCVCHGCNMFLRELDKISRTKNVTIDDILKNKYIKKKINDKNTPYTIELIVDLFRNGVFSKSQGGDIYSDWELGYHPQYNLDIMENIDFG